MTQEHKSHYTRDEYGDYTLYTAGYAYDTTEEQIKELFSPYGKLTAVMKQISKSDGSFNGVAFIKFENREQATKAIQALNDTIFRNKRIKVRFVDTDAEKDRKHRMNRDTYDRLPPPPPYRREPRPYYYDRSPSPPYRRREPSPYYDMRPPSPPYPTRRDDPYYERERDRFDRDRFDNRFDDRYERERYDYERDRYERQRYERDRYEQERVQARGIVEDRRSALREKSKNPQNAASVFQFANE